MGSWFIAYPVPAGAWLSDLPAVPTGTRLVREPDLHLTVAFLGRVEPRRARNAFESLPKTSIDRFEITLGDVVPMGNPRRPSALSALVEGRTSRGRPIEDETLALRDPLLEAAGAPPDTRPARPHVTLARVRRQASPRERTEALAWASRIDLVGQRLLLDSIALYTGSDHRNDRAYDIVETRSSILATSESR